MKRTAAHALAFQRSSAILRAVLLGTSLLAMPLRGQSSTAPAPVQPVRVSLYLSAQAVDFSGVVPPPPAPGSAPAREDLLAVHTAQARRTPAQVRRAQQDDQQEDIFIYADVLGPKFRAQDLLLTATLSAHVRNEAATVAPPLKARYGRPRPFVTDSTVHPVCDRKQEPSYPSGHAMVGYLEALTLAQMLPERSGAILVRADEYARNRVVCGVHYPSDVAASRTAALVEFGALSTSAAFQQELARARQEIRAALQPEVSTNSLR